MIVGEDVSDVLGMTEGNMNMLAAHQQQYKSGGMRCVNNMSALHQAAIQV